MSAQRHLVLLSGELDMARARRLCAQVETALFGQARTIVIDLGAVTFIDSSGVRCLLGAIERCRDRGRDVRVIAPRGEAPYRALRTMGLLERIPWLGDGESAGG